MSSATNAPAEASARDGAPADRLTAAANGLSISQFKCLGKNGIGDRANAYVHGMEYFEGRLYAGMTRHSFSLLKLFPPIDPPALDPWPCNVPPSVEDLDMQGQIWRWCEADGWELAYRSPLIDGKHGRPAPRDLGYRGMRVFQGKSDRKPMLYASTMSTVLRGCAAHVLRSEDGLNFEPASEPGLGNPRISTFRELISFDGHLYAPPAGEGVQFNSNRRSVVMRSSDPRPGNWHEACEPGFGEPTNNGIFMMAEANGFLYAGTFNCFEGYQIWKTPANGGGPCEWRKVIGRGAYRGPLSEIAMGICGFDGALYVGSSIQNGGYDRTNLVGPASGEIIRIWPDDSWDLLVGTPRNTPDGMKFPLSGMGPGFDNIFAGYTWRMMVHEGWLYVTTFDWSVFLQYANRPSPTSKKLLNGISYEQLVETGGGFELWRTRDGINWMPVSLNGMGNPYNYGGRTMVSTPEGLFIGTANPFTPETPARFASRWAYYPNPDGGTEVWLGNARFGGFNPAPPPRDKEQDMTEGSDSTCDIAITGGTGYIGVRLVSRLLDLGHRVRVLTLPGTEGLLPDHPGLQVVTGGLDDPAILDRFAAGAPVICHMAGRLAGSCKVPELRATNVQGFHNLLRACGRARDVRRFVFSSSVAVYQHQFNQKEWPISEQNALRTDGGHDLADYGMTKIAGENLLRHYARLWKCEHVSLRFSLVYGVGDPMVDRLIRELAPRPEFGTGQQGDQPRQFVHVDDAVEALMLACFSPEGANETYNIAGAEVTTYRDLGRMTRIALGKATREDMRPDRTRIWRRYLQQYDIGHARRRLGYRPAVPMAEGLRRIVEDMGPDLGLDTSPDIGLEARTGIEGGPPPAPALAR